MKTNYFIDSDSQMEQKWEFYINLKDRTENVLADTTICDMSDDQVREECRRILNTWTGDCPESVDAYCNGEYRLSEYVDEQTYDVVFNDDEKSDRKGFSESIDYCKEYIRQHNRTDDSYFADYKGGTVQIVCNETGDVVYESDIL